METPFESEGDSYLDAFWERRRFPIETLNDLINHDITQNDLNDNDLIHGGLHAMPTHTNIKTHPT